MTARFRLTRSQRRRRLVTYAVAVGSGLNEPMPTAYGISAKIEFCAPDPTANTGVSQTTRKSGEPAFGFLRIVWCRKRGWVYNPRPLTEGC